MVTAPVSSQVEREKLAILRILSDSAQAVGSKVIARQLRDEYSIELSERAVRYHLGQLDERGLTRKVSRRDGRLVTPLGMEEMGNAMVGDKVGFVIDKIELLAFQTTFDPRKMSGLIPVNFSIFPADQFKTALKAMLPCFERGLCISDLVAVAREGDKLAGVVIPEGHIGFATVCSIVINGVLLKAGIPTDSRFGGILQMNAGRPWRFSDLIQYSGSSLDPSEIFIAGRMTSIAQAVKIGDGKVLANFREIPAMSLELAHKLFAKLKQAGINAPLALGESSKPVCEVPVGLNKVGVVLAGGLNPVAAAVEAGCTVSNKAMSRVIDFSELVNFREI
jgi:HTH-type transcriptional regulator, global nitrogen regulator NrpRI